MKLAIFSPLNPAKTGISDYTEELLGDLSEHFNLVLFHDPQYSPVNQDVFADFPVNMYDSDRFDPEEFDEILYHMGNNYADHRFVYDALKKHPGVVVLHDYVMQGFYAERLDATGDYDNYRTLLSRYYGEAGELIADQVSDRSRIPIWESEKAFDFPLNEEILDLARGIIVHSEFIRRHLIEVTSKPVIHIPHHGHRLKSFDQRSIRKKLGIESDEDVLLLSAGFINKNKRFERIFSALQELSGVPWKYIIAGSDRGRLLEPLMSGREGNIIRRDHLPIEELEELIAGADICLNLRFPTMGESSGTLLRMMGYGKPTLVNNCGSYAEIPDFCVVKIDPDIDETEMIKRTIEALSRDPDFRTSIGREAASYVRRECSLEKCAAEYARFIRRVGENRPR